MTGSEFIPATNDNCFERALTGKSDKEKTEARRKWQEDRLTQAAKVLTEESDEETGEGNG